MKLAKKIATDPWFTRSINLTRDINSEDSIDAYIATSTTKTTLESISKGFENSKYPRAWTLIGPYGSGKSSFGLFLNASNIHFVIVAFPLGLLAIVCKNNLNSV